MFLEQLENLMYPWIVVTSIIAVVALLYSGETKALGRIGVSVAAFIVGAAAIGGLIGLCIIVANEPCVGRAVSVHTHSQTNDLASKTGSGGFDDTSWDADEEVCDVRDNDCGDIPITYEGYDVIIHYPEGDVRMRNWSSFVYPLSTLSDERGEVHD